MLIKPFAGLQENNTPSTYDSYLGVVADNNDPLKLGRVRVFIDIYEDIDIDSYPWAYPLLSTFLGNSPNSVSFSVPEIGSQVRVCFPTKDIYAPYYSGCELNEENKCTFFDEDYPDCYGMKDSKGNFVKVNKKTEKVTFQYSSTTNIEVTKDGTTTLTNPSGGSVSFDSVGNFTIDKGKEIQADFADLALSGSSATLDINSVTFTGDVKIDGSFSAVNGVSAVVPLPTGQILQFTNGILTGIK